MRVITSSRTTNRCHSAPTKCRPNERKQDRPHHQVVQPRQLRQPEIGDEADQRRPDQIEIKPDMHRAGEKFERRMLLRRRRRPFGAAQDETPRHDGQDDGAERDMDRRPGGCGAGRRPAVRRLEKLGHMVAGEPLEGDQDEHNPTRSAIWRAL